MLGLSPKIKKTSTKLVILWYDMGLYSILVLQVLVGCEYGVSRHKEGHRGDIQTQHLVGLWTPDLCGM